MSYFDNYDYCKPSVLDELVDDTTDKIKDMIINETKEKVNGILNKAKVAEDRLDIAYKKMRELNDNFS